MTDKSLEEVQAEAQAAAEWLALHHRSRNLEKAMSDTDPVRVQSEIDRLHQVGQAERKEKDAEIADLQEENKRLREALANNIHGHENDCLCFVEINGYGFLDEKK